MIGILGGTFDPVHNAHLRTALDVVETLGLEELRLIPNRVPPHRDMPNASDEQRLALLQAAVAPEPRFVVDTRELERKGPSYTVETLESIRREAGDDMPLCMITGADAFAGLLKWHRWQELFDLAHLVVMMRPKAELPTEGELARCIARHQVDSVQPLCEAPAGSLYFVPVTQLDISATRIREDLAAGRSVRWLLPEAVADLIEAQGLYRAASEH